MPRAVIPINASVASVSALEATRHARSLSPLTSSSLKTGTNEAPSAESATSDRTVFGTLFATTKALAGPDTPSSCAEITSRTNPSTRESPGAALKSAVETERLRAPCTGASSFIAIHR